MLNVTGMPYLLREVIQVRRVLSILVVCCLLLLSASALAERTFEKYDPPIEIGIGRFATTTMLFPKGDSLEDNIWYREYQNNMGVNIKHEWIAPQNEYTNRLNIVIASGDLPDIVVECTLSQLRTIVDAGLATDLTEVFETYATDRTKELMYGDGGYAMQSASVDGKLYALPYVNSVCYDPSLLWMRQDWLDNLGLEAPKTLEDVIAVAQAFIEQDPDGNGQDDTGGLAFSNMLFDGTTSLTGFFNAYHAYPQTWIEQEDGTLIYGSLLPEMKNALERLAKMYQDGLIDREFGVKDTAKVVEEVTGGKYGITFGRNWVVYGFGAGLSGQPEMKWTPVAAPSSDDQTTMASVGSSCVNYYVVSNDCPYPEAAVEMMNLYSDLVYGDRRDEGEYITVWEDGNSIGTSNYAVVRTSTPDGATIPALKLLIEAVDKRDKSLLAECITETDKYDPCVAYMDEGNNDYFMQYHQVEAFRVLVNEYGMERLIPTAFGGSTDTMSAKMGILNEYEKEMFTKIIMGEEPIEAFETFIDGWLRMGGDAITEEVNALS